MFSSTNLSNALRAISSALQTPVMFFLLFFAACTIILAGVLIAEFFTERRHMKVKLPELLKELKAGKRAPEDIIKGSALLKRQKKALLTITDSREIGIEMRDSLAAELLYEEKNHYRLRVKFTDVIMRLAPMFGLMGTLIPLGPGIIALGRGDTLMLSSSLLTAFDTTVAGLITAAAATVISVVRKQWYGKYMAVLEAIMECLLERLIEEEEDGTSGKYEKAKDTADGYEKKNVPVSENKKSGGSSDSHEKNAGGQKTNNKDAGKFTFMKNKNDEMHFIN